MVTVWLEDTAGPVECEHETCTTLTRWRVQRDRDAIHALCLDHIPALNEVEQCPLV